MADLSDRMRALLKAIRANAKAWQSPLEVAERLGWSVEETTDLLADLDLAGLIVVRESDESDPVIALVPLATAEWPTPVTSPRNPAYARPSRPRSSVTAAGSVTS